MDIKYGAIYIPVVNYSGGIAKPVYTKRFTKFSDKEAMEEHVRTCAKEADCYEYIRYETLKVSVKVEIE